MALTNNREKKICEKYSAYDEKGHVHCYECPLNKGNPNNYDFRCKANSHYDKHTKEWELDCYIDTIIMPELYCHDKEKYGSNFSCYFCLDKCDEWRRWGGREKDES